MAVRKSLILTPPEIYAECAHHGASRGGGGVGGVCARCSALRACWSPRGPAAGRRTPAPATGCSTRRARAPRRASCPTPYAPLAPPPPTLARRAGEEKAEFGWLKLCTLCIIAGCYVGFGFTLCLMVGGNLGADVYAARPGLFSLVYGAVGFPAAFTMIVVCGAELYTSSELPQGRPNLCDAHLLGTHKPQTHTQYTQHTHTHIAGLTAPLGFPGRDGPQRCEL
jgi:hypothetical protein